MGRNSGFYENYLCMALILLDLSLKLTSLIFKMADNSLPMKFTTTILLPSVLLEQVLTVPLVAVYPLFARLDGASLWILLISASAIKNVMSVCIPPHLFFFYFI